MAPTYVTFFYGFFRDFTRRRPPFTFITLSSTTHHQILNHGSGDPQRRELQSSLNPPRTPCNFKSCKLRRSHASPPLALCDRLNCSDLSDPSRQASRPQASSFEFSPFHSWLRAAGVTQGSIYESTVTTVDSVVEFSPSRSLSSIIEYATHSSDSIVEASNPIWLVCVGLPRREALLQRTRSSSASRVGLK